MKTNGGVAYVQDHRWILLIFIMFNMIKSSRNVLSRSRNKKFPVTLEGFGYYFNENGQLRSIDGNIPFRFEVKRGDNQYNQAHYEALGKVIDEHIYERLVKEERLEKVIIPVDAIEDEARSIIFVSKNLKRFQKMLILINGSGVVRAGQWTRKLIINNSLESGSQIPYIRKAVQDGYGIVVLNTNQNTDVENRHEDPVRGSESPEDHFHYVWDKIIAPTDIKNIAIMAHSYGGVVATATAIKRLGEFMERVFAVAMSDSVHGYEQHGSAKTQEMFKRWFAKVSRNWVSSQKPLNTPLASSNPFDKNRVSAGTTRHIETSYYAFSSVFDFFECSLEKRLSENSKGNEYDSGEKSTVTSKFTSHPEDSKGQQKETELELGGGLDTGITVEGATGCDEGNSRMPGETVTKNENVESTEKQGNSYVSIQLQEEGKDIKDAKAARRSSSKEPVEHSDTTDAEIQDIARQLPKSEL